MTLEKSENSDLSEEKRDVLEQLIQRFSVPSTNKPNEIASPLEDCELVIRPAQSPDREQLVELIADFRVTLGRLQGKALQADLVEARSELDGYKADAYRMYVAECKDAGLVGYLVCWLDGRSVWAESLFVRPDFRRQRIAWMLYDEAEALLEEIGGEMVYNRIDPNNDRIISFLAKRGYSVLNKVELRRPKSGEDLSQVINVGNNRFKYPR